jgi:prolyl-tRNA synthetase
MRLSNSYFYTLRESKSDEESQSGDLMVRAGMIKKTASGIYTILPLGLKALRKIENIVREEMDAINCQELLMPALIPEDVYIESGRREVFGDSMFSLQDRYHRPYVLGPTHEELFAEAAKMHIRSYKDLPFSLYQFQTKYRDEPRPRFGLIRIREFTMKDAYTFDTDLDGLDVAYTAMFEAYKRCFDRMGLDYVIVQADTGVMGGLLSEEFQALSPIGEDILVIDDENQYASNIEVAPCPLLTEPSDEAERDYRKEYTPNAGTIEEVTSFLHRDVHDFVKTLIYRTDADELVAVCVRGDHDVNETKLMKAIGANEIELADAEGVMEATGAPIGFAGPVGIHCKTIVDNEVSVMKNFIVGANEADHHLIDVNMSDFEPDMIIDVRNIQEGDVSIKGGNVRFARGIEVGNTFKLGTGYAESMDLYYVDENNQKNPVVMGSYGIGPARCLAAVVEQNHTDNAILWPKAVAPIQVGIVIVNMKNDEQVEVAEKLYDELSATKLDVLLDDRNERAGVKFNDMELIGVYARITCGRSLKDGQVEVKIIGEDEPRLIAIDDVKDRMLELFADV